MNDDVDGVLITDGRCRVFLHPPNVYADDVGFPHQVDFVGGPFSGSLLAESWYSKNIFCVFRDDLAKLQKISPEKFG